MKKGIILVSFGTTHVDTEKKTIGRIQELFASVFDEYYIYSAYTSDIVRKVLAKRDKRTVMDVETALQRMKQEGIEEVLLQPTHIIDGIENQKMKKAAEGYRDVFSRLAIGEPLLSSATDYVKAAEAVLEELQPDDETALLFMGHGTEHPANAAYAVLQDCFHRMGHKNVFVATVEGVPGIEEIMYRLDREKYTRLLLAPFMVVAGDHARNDMAGDADSWKNLLIKKGYTVDCRIQGLGEYEKIRNIYVEHAHLAMMRE